MEGYLARDEVILKTLKEELVGPCAYGSEYNFDSAHISNKDFRLPWKTKDGEEILKNPPFQRYGVGVLYPLTDSNRAISGEVESTLVDDVANLDSSIDQFCKEEFEVNKTIIEVEDDFDISQANSRFPSTMGLSFTVREAKTLSLKVVITGAFYRAFDVKTEKGGCRKWWKREPVNCSFKLNYNLGDSGSITVDESINEHTDHDKLSQFKIQGLVRGYHGSLIVTLALVNKYKLSEHETYIEKNEGSLFQSSLTIETLDDFGNLVKKIIPYAEYSNRSYENWGEEELSNELLYQNAPSFARGHGVAADWCASPYERVESVERVFTSLLPTFETPSITAEIEKNGEFLQISMMELSELKSDSIGHKRLKLLIDWYSHWINELRTDDVSCGSSKLQNALLSRLENHIEKCGEARIRMAEGLELIMSNSKVMKAFRLANLAMAMQQKRAPKSIRHIKSFKGGGAEFSDEFKENSAKGIWRPFQIGFLLMCISGAVNSEHDDRELVDLIWFPTGGGKTEAYLALAAFSMIYNRLCSKGESDGVQVLMRYTLRLLTAQQLQRAATLICCLDVLREKHDIPGQQFSIGLWVGSKNTPNTRKAAISQFKNLNGSFKKRKKEKNPFLLERCPYCGSEMGVSTKLSPKKLLGYKSDPVNKTVKFICEDPVCNFHTGIPVYVIDEDIYEERPSLVIATVDKFAMMAWNPKVRNLFGRDCNGKPEYLPPQLIIQDELHLINGPLGTMVGLYEPLIENLCSFTSESGQIIKPKIVCATATTNGYRDQVRMLYGREHVSIFPPPGVKASDSFFSRYARDGSGELLPGRKYVGVCAPGLGSVLTSQVRTHSALLFAPNRLNIEDRDPWVTLLSFYNSIRELGGAKTLFQADISSYLLELKRRYPEYLLPRYLMKNFELTSRLEDEDIPRAIAKLEKAVVTFFEDNNLYKKIQGELQKLKDLGLDEETLKLVNEIADKFSPSFSLSVESYPLVVNLLKRLSDKNISKPPNIRELEKLIRNEDVICYCLASSIIEVGVDIDRLSLMTIVGQPKTTAQYIQVSGRVGRRSEERPGLVVTIYNNSKPRDKSHYEDFRNYHQRLYSYVEPSSVTPFSKPAVKRAFSAVLVAFVRQLQELQIKPRDVKENELKHWFNEILGSRHISMLPEEKGSLTSFFEKNFLKAWKRLKNSEQWGEPNIDKEASSDAALCVLGSQNKKRLHISCPTSLRNVDGQTAVEIFSSAYDDFEDEW